MKTFLSHSLPAAIIFVTAIIFTAPAQSADRNTDLIAKGKYLTQMGDCISCHTATGGKPYAGGRPISTPFGTVYAPNITSDTVTGLGNWSFDEFWEALHNGKGRDGELLYPVFSYTSYTKVTQDDARAIYAYLQSLPPVRQTNREANMNMPYNIRSLLYAWRFLYFKPGVFQADNQKSAQWNRGAYIVEGLGHCNECHTKRNTLGAMNEERLVGGEIPQQGWYAPNLSMQKGGGLEGWTAKDIIDLLKTGISAKGSALGPMADVVRNSTQYLTQGDLAAVAEYLQSIPAPAHAKTVAAQKSADYADGEKLYSKHCANCHSKDGNGDKGIYPALRSNTSVLEPTGLNATRAVLLGGFSPVTPGNPEPYSMPPFAQQFSDKEIAAVVNYIRQSWGNNASPVTMDTVKSLRFRPVD